MSHSLITSSVVLFFGNYLFSAIIGLHLFNSNPVSMAIEDELENVCVTPKTSFSWSSLQIQLECQLEANDSIAVGYISTLCHLAESLQTICEKAI
jgi:hypothetical protein